MKIAGPALRCLRGTDVICLFGMKSLNINKKV